MSVAHRIREPALAVEAGSVGAGVVAAVHALAEVIADSVAGAEAAGRIGADTLALIGPTGCLRMLLPSRHGGLGLPWTQALPVVAELARIDGSLGWRVGQVGQAHMIIGCFPEPAQRAVLRDPAALAGSVAPKGRVAVEGPVLRVTGQWPFVTGVGDADWVYLNCLETHGRSIVRGPGGLPQTRLVLVPADAVEVKDTWQVLGLRATQSCDVACAAVEVDPAMSFQLDPELPGSAAVLDRIARSGLIVAACLVGLARGAVDDLLAVVAGGRRPTFSTTRLAESPVFHDDLGTIAVTLRTAQALLVSLAQDAELPAGPGDAADRAMLRAATSRVGQIAREVVEAAYRSNGGAAVHDDAPLQRRLRDAYTAGQHVVVGRSFYPQLGAALVGGRDGASF